MDLGEKLRWPPRKENKKKMRWKIEKIKENEKIKESFKNVPPIYPLLWKPEGQASLTWVTKKDDGGGALGTQPKDKDYYFRNIIMHHTQNKLID